MDWVTPSGWDEERLPGKRVRRDEYILVSVLLSTCTDTRALVESAARFLGRDVRKLGNVVKIRKAPSRKVSFLTYEDFTEAAFPALLESWNVDLDAGRSSHRSYRKSSNPPILHRKELLLPPDCEVRDAAAMLTLALEGRGLFDSPAGIGFRRNWEERLASAGISIRGHQIIEAGNR